MTKNRVNPHFKSKYADLGALVEETAPTLAKHGLSVVQAPECEYYGDSGAFRDILTTTVYHVSGQYIQFSTPLAVPGNANAQAYGSALTYVRRYAYGAALGIVTDEDDDGNAASEKSAPTKSRPAPKSVSALRVAARDYLKLSLEAGKLTKDEANFLWADYDEASHDSWLKMVESAATGEPTFVEVAK